MSVAEKLPPTRPRPMTVDEFLARPADGSGRTFELVHGQVRAQDAASDTHGTVQSNLNVLIGNHLRRARPGCRVVANPGIKPRLLAKWNYRIPDLGITCAPTRPDVHHTPDPIVLIEILSASNYDETWSNIPLYATLPSVIEILIVDSTKVEASLLRRGDDGTWPQEPTLIPAGGTITLTSISFETPLADAYLGTHLAGHS